MALELAGDERPVPLRVVGGQADVLVEQERPGARPATARRRRGAGPGRGTRRAATSPWPGRGRRRAAPPTRSAIAPPTRRAGGVGAGDDHDLHVVASIAEPITLPAGCRGRPGRRRPWPRPRPRGSSSTRSPTAPGATTPRSARPRTAAGVAVTARTAAGEVEPGERHRLRTARSSASVLPASVPSGRRTRQVGGRHLDRRATPGSRPRRRRRAPPPRRSPGTTGRRGRAAASATTAGSTWSPSAMSPTRTRSSVSATPARPGLAVVEGRHGVEQVRHVGHAGVEGGGGLRRGGGRVAGGHRHAPVDERRAPRRARRAARGPASRAPPRPSAAQPSAADQRRPTAARRCAGSWAPRRSGARNGPSRCRPSGARPAAGSSKAAQRRHAPGARADGGAVTTVGSQDVTPHRGQRGRHLATAARARTSGRRRPRRCTAGR